MKIILTRKLKLKSAFVYLKLQRKVCHNEIKEYLNSNIEFTNEIVSDRIKKYLCDNGIYDNQYNLTHEGQKIKETGLIKESEEGKYQIWYTQNDPLFGDRIFYLKRIKPVDYNSDLKDIETNFSGTFVSLPVKNDQNPDSEFTIVKTTKKYEEKKEEEITCIWTWVDIENSNFSFKGKFDTNKDGKSRVDMIDNAKVLDFKIDLNPFIPSILPDFNNETKRCRFKLENIKNNETYTYFEYNGTPERDGYELCQFEKVPIEPYNSEEAKKWQEKIINMELEKGYIHPDDFTGCIISTNQKEGFSAYSDQLDSEIPDLEKFLSEIDPSKKSDRGKNYWHLAAPLDLNIGIPQSLKIDHFSLEKNTKINLKDIALKFGKVPNEKVFYYDKYVTNYYQQRSVSCLLECFGFSQISVITDTNQQGFKNYLKKTNILLKDINSVFVNRKDAPHDRFFIFKQGDNFDVWTCTNSIDFIRFYIKGKIPPEEEGTILQSVTFTKVKQNVLGEELKDFIIRG